MTIALSLNVYSGLVLAADSAASVVGSATGGQVFITQIYQHAHKLFQIGDLPVGAITWGAGGFGDVSFEEAVLGFNSDARGSVEKIAVEFSNYLQALYTRSYGTWPQKPSFGVMVCGFSDDQKRPEEYRLMLPSLGFAKIRAAGETGCTWNGEIEAITRLAKGFSPALNKVLEEMGVTPEQTQNFNTLQQKYLEANLFNPIMPIQDAVNLARFLIHTTIEFDKFKPGAPTCGGPVDVATITKRDGFRWISKKEVR